MSSEDATDRGDLVTDPLLDGIPVHEGYKVLGGVVLYQKLGQGGMGAVYRGKHLRLGVDVALKVMAPPAGMSPTQADNFVQRFIREARTAASVKHSNLIRVYDVNIESNVYFLIMDFVDGESAGDRLKRKGRLGEREAVEIALGAAEGLGQAHKKGIVHRDVKPDNILVDKEGSVVVGDLGLAKAFGGDETDGGLSMELSLAQQAMGTPYFMSPEQTRSAKDVGPQADVWSLGVTLYQLVTDTVPWQDTDISDLIQKIRSNPVPDVRSRGAELSDGLCWIIDRALTKEPEGRYANCGEMADALSDHLDTMGTSRKSVLPDAGAGSTREALFSVTPPLPQAITLIGKSRMGSKADTGFPGPAAVDEAKLPSQETTLIDGSVLDSGPPRRGWALPAAVVGGVILLAATVLGTRLGRTTQEESIASEAQRFLERVMEAVDEDRLEDAGRWIEDADTRYFATPSGPEIARMQKTIATRKQLAQEEEERARKEKERLAETLAKADEAEKAGSLVEALNLLRRGLGGRDDPELEKRVSTLERAVAAMRLIEDAAAFEKLGQFDRAKDAYERAIPDATGDARGKARQCLADLERRMRDKETADGITREVDAREWRRAWDSIELARKAGVKDPRLNDLSRRVVGALAPPKTLTGPLGVEFVLVPGGTFMMGSDAGADDEKPVHEVTVTSFCLGRFEVTRAQFEAFRRKDGSVPAAPGARDRHVGQPPLDDLTLRGEPAVSVTWREAADFCRYLTSLDRNGVTYRLPTEAEWEYAARGKEGRVYPWGNQPPTSLQANLAGTADGHAGLAPVGSFPQGATPEGTMDLVGNAAEWCADWHGAYGSGRQEDPTGPAIGNSRVLRGGAFGYDATIWSRAATRVATSPLQRSDRVGFRVVRALTTEEQEFLLRSVR